MSYVSCTLEDTFPASFSPFWVTFSWPSDVLQSYCFNIYKSTDTYTDTHAEGHVAAPMAGVHWVKVDSADNTKLAQHATNS